MAASRYFSQQLLQKMYPVIYQKKSGILPNFVSDIIRMSI